MRMSLLLAAGAIAASPSLALAVPIEFVANLAPANGSGVNGTADLSLDGNLLTVNITASGLTPNMVHPQHIHGRFDADGDGAPDLSDGTPIDSFNPTLAQDTDNDGLIEVLEGAATVGPVILNLTAPPTEEADADQLMARFPVADADGNIDFTETYDLTNDALYFDPLSMLDFEGEDVLPLDLRVVELHGLFVDAGIGAGTPGEVNGTGGYLAVLPVASGEIFAAATAVPEPGTLGLLAAGLAGLGLVATRRSKTA